MQKKTRIRRTFLWLLAAIMVLIVLDQAFGPVIPSWRVERAISHFRAVPSQEHAAKLVHMLEGRVANDDQIRRALTLLLQPNIVTRAAYSTGRGVTVSVEHPFSLDSDGVRWQNKTISVSGGPTSNIRGLVAQKPHLTMVGLYREPGSYPTQIDVQCVVGIERAGLATKFIRFLDRVFPSLVPQSMGGGRARTYECSFTMTAQIRIVPENEAERVELVSSRDLDQAMRAVFSSKTAGGTVTYYAAGSVVRWIRNSGTIVYESLPAAVAFDVVLRLPDGREVGGTGLQPRRISARAGDSGVIEMKPPDMAGERLGRYNATLVLRPALDLAYEDPKLKTLWNGTIELPMSFHVDANTPQNWPPVP